MIPEDKARHWRALALAREAIELGARVAVAKANPPQVNDILRRKLG